MIIKISARYTDQYSKRIEGVLVISASRIPYYHVVVVRGKEAASTAA